MEMSPNNKRHRHLPMSIGNSISTEIQDMFYDTVALNDADPNRAHEEALIMWIEKNNASLAIPYLQKQVVDYQERLDRAVEQDKKLEQNKNSEAYSFVRKMLHRQGYGLSDANKSVERNYLGTIRDQLKEYGVNTHDAIGIIRSIALDKELIPSEQQRERFKLVLNDINV
jgi:hypothetical protein